MSRSLRFVALAALTACGAPPSDSNPSSAEQALQQCPPATTVNGVDVYTGDGTIDWATAHGAGIDFAFIKATQGDYTTDSKFATNWSDTRANGVIRGPYHFFDPTVDGVAQANYFLSVVGTLQPGDLPPMLDVECPDGDTNCLGFANSTWPSAATIHQRILDFLTTVEAATGRKPGIYTFNSYFSSNGITDTDLAGYPLWIATLTPSPACFNVPASWSSAEFNQFSWNATVAGFPGQVDEDQFQGTVAELQAFAAGEPFRLHRGLVADLNGDGRADVCGRGPNGIECDLAGDGGPSAHWSGPALSDDAGWSGPQYASTIQFGDIDGDHRSDLCARSASGMQCWLSTGNGFGSPVTGPAWSDSANWNQAGYDSTIQLADVDGDGKADLCGRAPTGLVCYLSSGSGFPTQVTGPSISDSADWNSPQYYSTIRMVDVDGDGKADVCGRAKAGIVCWRSLGTSFDTNILSGPAWSDANGWDAPTYYETIQYADINGDGKMDVCGRGPNGVECWLSNGTGFPTQVVGPTWSDASGWDQLAYGSTVQFADIDGDGKADVCGRSATGVTCYLSNGTSFPTMVTGPALTDATGWNGLPYFWTIELADVTGDGRADLCARGASGYRCYPSLGTSFATSYMAGDYSDASGWNAPAYFATVTLVGGLPASTTTTTTSTGTGSSTTGSSSSSSSSTDSTTSTTTGTTGTTTASTTGTSAGATTTGAATGTTGSGTAGASSGSTGSGATKGGCGSAGGGLDVLALAAIALAVSGRRRGR
ncbi:MAG: VCBS repeat-containing protein [Deltaproteobacteria bacterium]|nr:VCBS repeat-containing protein [Deltaproteobacteria bacterium]